MPVPRLRDRRYEGFMANSSSAQAETGTRRLDSWKEIANYLDRDVTTVMRWERDRALPVHRVPGHAKRQTVYAYPKEIDDWLLGKGNGGSGLGVGETKTEVRSLELEVRSHDRSESDHRTPEIGESEVRSSGQATGGSEKGIRDSGLGVRQAEKDVLSPWMAALVPHGRRQFFVYLLTGCCVAVAAMVVYVMARPAAIPKVLGYRQISNDGRLKDPPIVTDGARIYFSELTPSGWAIAAVPGAGGEIKPLSTNFVHPRIQNLSRSRSEILILDPIPIAQTPNLWAMPLSGGVPRRIGNVAADAATWILHGNSIVYAAGNELFRCGPEGSDSRKFASLPGRIKDIHLSPNGNILRLALTRPGKEAEEIWEVRGDGSDAQPFLHGWRSTYSQSEGQWTPDGKYYLFGSSDTPYWNLWALSEEGGILGRRDSKPIRLTDGPLSVDGWVPSTDGKEAFALEQVGHDELLRYDRETSQFMPYLPGVSANTLEVSGDGKWITYTETPDSTLWWRRIDGGQAKELTFPSMRVELPRWSPDRKWIAFMGLKHDDDIWKVYLVPAYGGEFQVVLPSKSPQGAPTWSPDGKRLAFGDLALASGGFPSSTAIHIVDLTTHSATTLADSNGLWTARWSPDGRHMAAITTDAKTLKVFDFATSQWKEVASASSISDLNWNHKGDAVYFLDIQSANGPVICRVRLQDRKVEKVTVFNAINPIRSSWLGVTPDDSLLISNQTGTSEIYALNLDLP